MKLKEKVFLQELREQFLQKVIDQWQTKWETDFDEFVSFEAIKNKNAFLESLIEDIEKNLYQKLNGQSSKLLFSKDFLRRFIYEYGSREARIQSHSRNAISIYLDYENWEDFVEKNKELATQSIHINYVNVNESFLPALLRNQIQNIDNQNFIEIEEVKPKWNIRKYFYYFVGVGLLGVGLFYLLQWYKNRPYSDEDLSKVKFKVIKTVGQCPQSIRVMYDVSALRFVDDVTVNIGVGRIIDFENQVNLVRKLPQMIDTISQTYFYPGIYQLSLMVNGKAIKSLNHVVYSKPNVWNVWGYGVAYEKDWITDIHATKTYIKDGIFHFDPKELPKDIKQDEDLRNAVHVLTQDFGVSSDSLSIAVRMKNPESDGGESCYDMEVSISDKNFNRFRAEFTTEGCTDYATLAVGKTIFRMPSKHQTKEVDLDNFGVNQDEWNVFKIVIKGQHFEVFVNDKSAFKGKYETNYPIAEVVDARITFKGAGSIDWVKITNSFTGKTVYQTDFDE